MRGYFLGLIITFIIAGNIFCLDEFVARDIKNYVEAGKQDYKNKKYNSAVANFKKAYDLSPDSPELKYNLSRAYIGQAVEKKDKGDVESARKLLKDAINLVDNMVDARVFLASIYLNEGDYVSSKGELEIAKIYDADNPAIYIMLGEIYFQQGDPANAIKYWDNSITNPSNNISLSKKLARAKREWIIQKNFVSKTSHPFRLMYGKNYAGFADRVLKILKSAYADIGQKLDYYPLNEVIVIIYEADEFFEATSAKGPVASLYDGKIRIRLSPKLNNDQYLKSIVYHEYTHVLVRYLTNDNCPFWLNEGLAQVFSEPVTKLDLTTVSNLELESDLFSLKLLENFEGDNKWIDYDIGLNKSIRLAYIKSLISTSYILKNYGLESCIDILNDLKHKKSIDNCVKKRLNISINELDVRVQKRISEVKDKLIAQLENSRSIKKEDKVK